MHKHLKRLMLLAGMLALLATSAVAQDNRLNVVATTTIIADVARNVGGDLVEVQSLIPSGADVHAFIPAPQDALLVEQADIVLVNGAGLEEFLEDLVAATAGVEPVVVSNGIQVIAYGGHAHGHEHGDEEHGDEEHGDEEHGDEEHGDDEHGDEEHGDEEHADEEHAGMAMGGSVTGAYMQITNAGVNDDVLIAARTEAARTIEIHETRIEDDIARMIELEEGLPIPAGETVMLEPGGAHVMLIGLPQDLLPNETVSLTLVFASGAELTVDALITDMIPVDPVTVEGDNNLSITGAWVRPALADDMSGDMDMDMGDMHSDEEHGDEEHGDEEHADEEHADDEHGDHHMHEGVEYIGVLGADAECDSGHSHEGEEHADEEHADEEHADDDHGDEHGDEHDHGACDPHFWTDPINVMLWADNIAAAFAAADPDNADTYTANAEAYKAQLMALNDEISDILSVIPEENRVLVTNHEFMAYFAAHYDFEIVGVVLPGGTTLAEPNPQALAELVETIEMEGAQAIIAETTDPSQLARTIAGELARPIDVVTLYSGSLSEADGPAATYLDYMRFNAQTLADALSS